MTTSRSGPAHLPDDAHPSGPTPAHFAQATQSVSREDIAAEVPCGPDPDAHIEVIDECVDAGFDMVAIHQVGSRQEVFHEDEVLPTFD